MRRLLPVFGTVAAVIVALTVFKGPTSTPALVGPEGSNFEIVFEELGSGVRYDRIPFTAPWDFADRESYRCALLELFAPDGTLLMLVEFERSNAYSPGIRINDRGGAEHNDGDNPVPFPDPNPYDPDGDGDICGSGAGQAAWTPSGEDHFDHYIPSHLEGHSPVDVYVDGERADLEFPGLVNADCDPAYWVPGDEGGEAILWWDADGPTEHSPGEMLNCNGGPGEPQAVARVLFRPMQPNVGVCVHDSPEHLCVGQVEPPATPVALGPGTSELSCPTGLPPALVSLDPFRVLCP